MKLLEGSNINQLVLVNYNDVAMSCKGRMLVIDLICKGQEWNMPCTTYYHKFNQLFAI